MQKQEDGQCHPVAFRLASMQPAERNYEIYDREMLAIIEALKDWRNFLEGPPHHSISSLIILTSTFGAQLKTLLADKLAGLYTFHDLTST